MKIKELISKLNEFNQDAELTVIAHNKAYAFTIAWGGAEGSTKTNTDDVSFYVDELCTNEKK